MARLQFIYFNKLVILVYSSNILVLHLLGYILEETSPARGRTQLWDEVRSHLNALVCCHDWTATRNMMNMIQISAGVIVKFVEGCKDTSAFSPIILCYAPNSDPRP